MNKDNDIFEELKPKGFIADFTKDVLHSCKGTNPDYVQMIAEAVLGGVCVKIRIYDQIGELNLNTWGLAVAPSGFYKSVVFKYYVGPLYKMIEAKLPKGQELTLPARFSPEGLIEAMTWHKETTYNEEKDETIEYWTIRNKGLMWNDEFTQLVKGIKNKKWMSDTSELLSQIYDGQVSLYYTKKDKAQSVPHCNVSFVSATTPYIYTILTEDFFRQGLGNRINIIVYESPEKIKHLDPEEFFNYHSRTERHKVIKSYAIKLLEVYNSTLNTVSFPPKESGKLWTEYKAKVDERIQRLLATKDRIDELKASYLQRNAEKALKLAGIYCISRNIERITKMKAAKVAEMPVRETDMQYAIFRVEKYYEYFEEFLRRWINTPYKGSTQTDIADIERMMNIILQTPHHLISNPQWMREAGYGFKNKFYELKAYLIAVRNVRELTEDEKRKLAPTIKEELEVKRFDTKIYRPTDSYYTRRRLPNPFKR